MYVVDMVLIVVTVAVVAHQMLDDASFCRKFPICCFNRCQTQTGRCVSTIESVR